jgi:hypothetical protein
MLYQKHVTQLAKFCRYTLQLTLKQPMQVLKKPVQRKKNSLCKLCSRVTISREK